MVWHVMLVFYLTKALFVCVWEHLISLKSVLSIEPVV